ncbi:hypothetical protein LAZ67_8002021 [Cordylochernes scorpioides]|uniref:Reverse transcriptase domain-containing protein n=1 Tax=Cordylochernes scorpioides TaxID=51811 RepID=A0ABY6KQN1_9ARAC|nr:hypothetical protein LAZ67_8002021 [Cordylochernes scorpioides]
MILNVDVDVIQRLRKTSSLEITKADKGNQTVLMDRADYEGKMMNILADTSTFKIISTSAKDALVKGYKSSLRNLMKAKQITKAQLTQFTGSLTRDAYIYGAPKIHKPGVPLRPIIAYHLSPAHTLAKYLAQLLSPIMKNNPNQYNITHPPSFVQEITQMQLPAITLCTFTFNHQHYKQIRGTPMGSPLSSIVAEVVMGSLDQWINRMHSSDIHYWRRTLTKRIHTHCSLPIFKAIEKNRITTLLTTAGYPRKFIDRHTFDPAAPRTSTTYRAVCYLPYSSFSVAIPRILRPYGIQVYFNSPPNLAALLRNPITKADAPNNPIHSTGAVYAVSCQDCPASYVGETGRTAHPNSDCSFYLRQLRKKSAQLSRWRCHLRFNRICKDHQFIPPSLRIKDPVKNPFSEKITKKYQWDLLESRIQGCHSNIRIISKTVKGLIFHIGQLLPMAEFTEVIMSITRDIQHKEKILTGRQQTKLSYWVKKYQFPQSAAFPSNSSNGIVNLSSIPLSKKEERVLALGLHYVPPDKPDIPRPYHLVSHARDHRSLIQRLRKTSSLVITKADKGNQTVLMDRADYEGKMMNILADTSTFKIISTSAKDALVKGYKSSLRNLMKAKQITKAQLTQFTGSLTRDAYIYGAPKIHKPGVPLRPIIAYHLSPAHTLAKYLAQLLSPIMKNNPNQYNITHPPSFVQEITQMQLPAHHTMVSFDVTALYLSLPHSLILNKLQSFLKLAGIQDQTITLITQLTSLCLSISTFTFNHQHYKQIRGTPMGSPLSSIVAEVVMGSLDQWINRMHSSDIHYWRRYVDDIFCVIKPNELQPILNTLHSFHADIKFTYEIETNLVLPFLDILIIRTPHRFHTAVYYKKNIPPLYTHFSSNSPVAYKVNTVRTLTKRIHTHCSLPIFKAIEKNRITTLLTTAGYPRKFIDRHTFDPAAPRTSTTYRAVCYLPYSSFSVAISRILRPYGIQVYFNSPPNLAALLRNPITKADAPNNPIHSTGAVYAVSCQDCPASYVGETGRTALPAESYAFVVFTVMSHPNSDCSFYLRQLRKKSAQLSRWRCHLRFNRICKDHQFIPPSLRIKDPVKNPFSEKITKKYQWDLLESRIQGCHSNIRIISKTVKGLIFHIGQLLPMAEFTEVIMSITRDIQHKEKILTGRQQTELSYWVKKYQFPQSAAFPSNSSNGIVNLSSIPLSKKEERVLALGLHYVPPDKPDIPRLIAGVEGALKDLNHMETLRIRHAVTQVLRRPYHLVSHARDHRSLIQRLRKTSSLVITKADKGNQTVLMDRADYEGKMMNILADTSTFKIISTSAKDALVKGYKSSLRNLMKAKQITKAQLTQFTGSLTRDAYIYGAPKIHKPGVPLRPIIAYHLSPAHTLAKYLAQLLSPIMKNNPNQYNITHPPSFVQEITQMQLPAHHTMVSFDVTALYLSLPHSLILNKLQSFLKLAGIQDQTITLITQLTSLCLSISTFTFNHQHYKQIRGTPMGSPLSSIVAEVVMGSLDQWINRMHSSDIHYWRRYVDDIFCVIKPNELQPILNTLHSFHADIKFTYEIETNLVLPFLDILIIRTPHRFHTAVYYKKNIPPLYTHFSSNSPVAYKVNTVRTLTKRIHTHCSLPIFKAIEKNRITTLLTTAGYPRKFIDRHTFDPAAPRTSTTYRAVCYLPYSSFSVAISRILRPYGIQVYFNSPPNLAALLRNPITKADAPNNPIHSTGAMTVALRRVNAMQGETEFRSPTPGRNDGRAAAPDECYRDLTPTTEESSTAMPYPYTAPESNPHDPGQCKQSQPDIPVPDFPLNSADSASSPESQTANPSPRRPRGD